MPKSFRIAFMGTPEFAVPILEALAITGHQIAAVYSQPPRIAGRGQKERISRVHSKALSHGFEVRTPVNFKDVKEQEYFHQLNLDVAVVAAYGLILPKSVLSAPNQGCINIHASLLPRWRGAAPIQRAIMAGDTETGITIMKMDQGLDTGPVLLQKSNLITEETTGQSLHDQLSALGAKLIIQALNDMISKRLVPRPQSKQGVTYAAKLEKEDGRINWAKSSAEIDRQVRALSKSPGAWFEYGNDRVKVLKSQPLIGSGKPGQVIDGLSVCCGDGVLQLEMVQRPGKNPMSASEFLNGYDVPSGTVLV